MDDLAQIRAWIVKERDYNHDWIARHIRDGHPDATERRREIVAERERWIATLDRAISEATANG